MTGLRGPYTGEVCLKPLDRESWFIGRCLPLGFSVAWDDLKDDRRNVLRLLGVRFLFLFLRKSGHCSGMFFGKKQFYRNKELRPDPNLCVLGPSYKLCQCQSCQSDDAEVTARSS